MQPRRCPSTDSMYLGFVSPHRVKPARCPTRVKPIVEKQGGTAEKRVRGFRGCMCWPLLECECTKSARDVPAQDVFSRTGRHTSDTNP
jgi:hypothetical protein